MQNALDYLNSIRRFVAAMPHTEEAANAAEAALNEYNDRVQFIVCSPHDQAERIQLFEQARTALVKKLQKLIAAK